MEKVTNVKFSGRSILMVLAVFVLIMGMLTVGMIEINAADEKAQFDTLKSEAKAEISSLKNDNSLVVSAVNRYLAQVDYITYSESDAANSPTEYINKLRLAINDIVSDAHKEADFLNKRLQILEKLQGDYKSLVASGNYTGEARKILDETYSSIAIEIGKVTLAEGSSKLSSVYGTAKDRFNGVTVFVSAIETDGTNGSFAGRVHSTLGFPSSKNLTITKQALKAPSGRAPKNDVDQLSPEAIFDAIKEKENLFTFHLKIDGYNDTAVQDNGAVYTIRLTLADEYQGSDRYSVISYDASGNEYVHKTVKYGKYVEFKTTMLSNDFTLVSDITKNMTWVIVLLAILALVEIIATVLFTLKKNKLASFAVIPFLAVMYTPGSFGVIVGILAAVAVTGAALTVLSAVMYFKAKKASEEGGEDKTSSEAKKAEAERKAAEKKAAAEREAAKKEAAEKAAREKAEKEAAERAQREKAEREAAERAEREKAEKDAKKKSAAAFIALSSQDDDDEDEDDDENEEVEENDLEDGAYSADDERYNSSKTKESNDKDDAEYEADSVSASYVAVKNDGDGDYEDDTVRSYSGFDGEYEADGDGTGSRKAVAKDEEAEYGLSDDYIFESKDSNKKSGKSTVVIPVAQKKNVNDTESDESDSDEADKLGVADDLEDEKRVFSFEAGEKVYVTYDYSFESKLCQSTEEVQYRYHVIADTLFSYGLRSRQSWKKERYFNKGTNYAKMIFKGKTLCVCLAIDPSTLKGTKYSFEDISSVKKYDDVPVMVRVRSQRSQKYVLELIDMMMADAGLKQLRAVKDEFDIFPPMSKAELVENGAIKVMMTDGNGEAVSADFETMKNSKFNLVTGGITLHKHVSVDEVAQISDEDVAPFIQTEVDLDPENDDEITYGSKKGIINIDTISSAYNDGDVVTVASLIEKGLIQKNIHFIKVLARGELDKVLTVKAHDFSMDAAKMIVVAGGNVVKLKSKKVKD